jgi:hypothetical protein
MVVYPGNKSKTTGRGAGLNLFLTQKRFPIFGAVAQQVERRFEEPGVGGSIPLGPTIFKKGDVMPLKVMFIIAGTIIGSGILILILMKIDKFL